MTENMKVFRPARSCVVTPAILASLVATVAVTPVTVQAQGVPPIHWETDGGPATPKVIDSLPANMKADLAAALASWNVAPEVEGVLVQGGRNGQACIPTRGAIRACVYDHAFQFPASTQLFFEGRNYHLMSARLTFTSAYLNEAPWNTSAGRQHSLCYGLGLALGVFPQDVDAFNPDLPPVDGKKSCTDYSITPEDNLEPNAVDYGKLAEIYAHSHTDFGVRDAQATVSTSNSVTGGATDIDRNLGRVVAADAQGRPLQFERTLPNGTVMLTIVHY